jgi:hypothetical protein
VPQLVASSATAARNVARKEMRFTGKILREISIRMLAAWNFRGKGNVWLPAKRMGKTDGHCVNASYDGHQRFAGWREMTQSRMNTA